MIKFYIKIEPETLTRLSQLEISKKLWSHPQIAESLKSLWQKHSNKDTFCNEETFDKEVTSEVVCNIEKLRLPRAVAEKLKDVVEKMGHVLLKRLIHIYAYKRLIPIDVEKFIDHIKWTHDGDVDTSETVRSMYFSGTLPYNGNTYLTLTHCWLEDCIFDFCGRVPLIDDPSLEDLSILKPLYCDTYDNSNIAEPARTYRNSQTPKGLLICPAEMLKLNKMIPLYWHRRLQNRLDDFLPELKIILGDLYQESESLEVNVFWHSMSYEAQKCLWQFLNDDQRTRYLRRYIEPDWPYPENSMEYRSFVFFWKQAALYRVDDFINNMFNDGSLIHSLIWWPYENLLSKTLQGAVRPSNSWLVKILKFICEKHLVHRNTTCTHCGIAFQEIWLKLKAKSKASIDHECYIQSFRSEVDVMDLVVNDPANEFKRDRMILELLVKYRENRQYVTADDLDNVCKVVLRTEEERQTFRCKFHHYPSYLYVAEYYGESNKYSYIPSKNSDNSSSSSDESSSCDTDSDSDDVHNNYSKNKVS